jgi:signal transduction histidine kinase
LIENYFSDSNRLLWLKEGEYLLKRGQYNSRLYLVRSGRLKGHVEQEDGSIAETLTAEKNHFIGVYSFFSRNYKSIATIQAATDCELAFIDRHTPFIPTEDAPCLEKQFMPVVITDLMNRQQRLLEISAERQQTMKRLMENQSLASLGQMAAGIAHELNNAVAVLASNSNWLVEQLSVQWTDPKQAALFESGLIKGRFLSSREVRQRKKELTEKFHFDNKNADMLAQTGITDEMLSSFSKNVGDQARSIYYAWEMGAVLHDMTIAAEQSTHVVQSIKTLGSQHKKRSPNIDINDTISNALALLRHRIKHVHLNLDLQPLPTITANTGEFVQVWTNLIKNALEAMAGSKERDPELSVESAHENDKIIVRVHDNGPGIPNDILPTIFQPNVTTKVDGLSFGLGLGLTIIQRIIHDYGGKIDTRSSKNGVTFTIYIPVGGNNEQD